MMERIDAIEAVNAFNIDVAVANGMVTLKGDVDTRQTRFQVERAVRRVSGVRGPEIDLRAAHSVSGKTHH